MAAWPPGAGRGYLPRVATNGGARGAARRGAVRKDPGGRLGVVLVFPNVERVGLANLGVHAVYRLLNEAPDVRCELAFLPEGPGEPLTLESGAPLRAFDVIAFSLAFEEDHVALPALLSRAGVPRRAAARTERDPLVVAGGIAMQINPEPVAPFLDAVLVGEAEALLPDFLAALRASAGAPRGARLRALAGVPGVYVPGRYRVAYADTRGGEGWVLSAEPEEGTPARVERRWARDVAGVATARVLDAPDALFGDLHLVELARGCLWGCRFCAAGFVQRPYRETALPVLRDEALAGMARGQGIGLVGPDVSDHSGLEELTTFVGERGGRFSPSSLRVDAITPALARRMAAGGERSITLAPEAGTPRLRRVLNKDFDDDVVVEAGARAIAAGMEHVKLYFMFGLPTETDPDVEGMARLALRLRDEVLAPRARASGRMGRLTLSVNPFVPKPWTPFQWLPMADRKVLERRRRILERLLRPRGVEVDVLSPRRAALQTLLSRGDRRTADLLELSCDRTGGDVGRALRLWPEDPDFFVHRPIPLGERLPWDVLEQGVAKEYLARELRRGLDGRVTPPCDLDACRACGLACADRPPGAAGGGPLDAGPGTG